MKNITKPLSRIVSCKALIAITLSVSLSLGLAPKAFGDWTSLPVGGGGFITGMTMSGDGSGIYVRTDVGGAYRWIPATSSWKPITEALPRDSADTASTYGIGSIAVAPDNANKVYIASGGYYYSSPSGISVTSDSTAATPSWTTIDSTIRVVANGVGRQYGERLTVDPNNPAVVYFGTYNVTNGGTGLKKYVFQTGAWVASSLYAQPPAIGDANVGITFVACDKNGGVVTDGARSVSRYIYLGVYSATAGSGGVYASSDGGTTWTKVTAMTVDTPARGEVSPDGTLYVTYSAGVVKLDRGTTTFTSIPPAAPAGFVGLAVDPSNAATVMVAGNGNSIYRSLDHGSSWTTMTRTIHATEPDGTPSVTSPGSLLNISDLMINPANANEVWTGDFLAVQRTQNIGVGADWYCLQKNLEEIVPLALKSAPTGAPIMSSDADVDGYTHGDVGSRSLFRFNNPSLQVDGGSTTSLDFCESTFSGDTVMVRAFDSFYGGGTGAVSVDDGASWIRFGQIASRLVHGYATAGWEEWDLTAYLARQKALGVTSVTLCVASDNTKGAFSGDYLSFDSKEGTNIPQLVVNGATPVAPTADAYIYQYAPTTTYNNPKLNVSFNQNSSFHNRRSYLSFDLTSLPAITSAKLRLYRNVAAAGDHYFPTGIFATDATAWTESTLTWNNQPVLLSGSSPQYYPSVPNGSHGGRVALSAADPANIVWVNESGRIYYSKDRGVTWGPGTLGGSNLVVSSMSEFSQRLMPLASDRVAASTFYVFSAAVGGGTIYRSTDGGVTWATLTTMADTYAPRPQYKIEAIPGASGKFWIMTEFWNSGVALKYWNGSSLVTVPNISGVVNFAFGKGSGSNPAAYILKSDNTFWTSTDATAGSSYTWTQMTGLTTINSGIFMMEGDRQNFGRLYIGTGGRGIMYTGGSTIRTFHAQDSTVRDSTYASTNQAGTTSTTIDVKTDASPYNREGYFQFDFASYSGTVSAASITLVPTTTGTTGLQQQVSLVTDNSWAEDAITWNNKPASSTVLGTFTAIAGTPMVIPVTAQVAAAMATGKVISIRVSCATPANSLNIVNYASSESTALSWQPVLKITP